MEVLHRLFKNKILLNNIEMSKKTNVVKTVSRCCVWDFTFYGDDVVILNAHNYHAVVEELHISLDKICKKYCFQLEKGDKTGRLHFQGRISLKEKSSLKELQSMLVEKLHWQRFHLSPTSNENRTNDFYVQKDETRIDGPFTNENYISVPRDVRAMVTLRPWQASLRDELMKIENRVIDVMVEEKGDLGKTAFCRFMAIKHGAQILPFCNDYKDIMRMAYDVGAKPIYMIDIPRSIRQKALAQLYGALESLKGGYAYDDRNTFRQRYFDPPRVIVFTNTMPDSRYLSQDRWKLWQVTDKMKLRPYSLLREEYDDDRNVDIGFDSFSDQSDDFDVYY